MSRAVVKNSADPDQVKYGKRKEQRTEDERFNVLVAQLSTYHGRQFVCMELARAGIDDKVSGPPDDVNRFLGRREHGLDLRTEIMTQHPARYFDMLAEATARLKRSDAESEAVAMTLATQEQTNA
jgi:hypothetical protein